ncbi:DUF2141 domain-containing protein [Siansivirga zeaxanthinifaciens]|uniref:DUF2141 domain-containing protein n=1 Tax=Siansivirga zeaxanthinifaciens CC-SAMT-1 TaxID=1454006 RepID=A0A0C5VXD4_9FLAO|nr:DUF2141 domain-containing protein [Siansivirga zeaxanthinifaciens]AJR03746.1 hypothetical protein AW14_09065 [Siansivirga zeaxanthinifaciens CC-SAMT-1]
MKTITTIIALLLFVNFTQAQETNTGKTITVKINNIANNNGQILVSLNNEATFMKGKGIQNLKSTIENGSVILTFKNVEPGIYAIIAFHDENSNNQMDFETNGIPKESYGASNNDMSFGPPQFNTAKFQVRDEDVALNIKL